MDVSTFSQNKSIIETLTKNTDNDMHILHRIRTLLGPDNKIYMEIGAGYGDSLALMLQHTYPTEYHNLDQFNGPPDRREKFNANIAKHNKFNRKINYWSPFSGDRQFVLGLRNLRHKVDMLYINDHDHAIMDFALYKEFVNPGGFILIHTMPDHIRKNINNNYTIIGCFSDIWVLHKNNLLSGPDYIPIRQNEDIRFGIVMSTYFRSNNITMDYLRQSLDSVIHQNYTQWDLIIIGDKYELEGELLQLLQEYRKLTPNKIIYLNNYYVERDHIANRVKLWHIAGAASMNMGLNYCRNNGYSYYAHLDDDDTWTPDHLESLAEIYQQHPHCIFAFAQSEYTNNQNLPGFTVEVKPNNFIPQARKLIHSAVTFRCDIIPFDYLTTFNINDYIAYSDGTYWDRVKDFLSIHPEYCSIYSSKLTCQHIVECASLN